VTSSLTQRLIVGFLIFYFLAGVAVYKRTPTDEIYPFFSWSLFRDVPQRTKRIYTLQITAIGGKKLEEPVFYKDAPGLFTAARVDNANYLFNELARTYFLHDEAGMSEARRRIEYGLPGGTEYNLIEADIDTVAFWKSGGAIRTQVLTSFTSEKP